MTISIAVLGGSLAAPGSADYEQALAVGREVARRGGRVVCGGGGGVMEAVCRGASEAGGRSLGILVGPGEPNRWVGETVHASDLASRLLRLAEESSAAIFLPRGLGTLLELAWISESIVKERIEPRPIVFLGLFWRRVAALAVAEAAGPGAGAFAESLRFTASPQEAVAAAYRG